MVSYHKYTEGCLTPYSPKYCLHMLLSCFKLKCMMKRRLYNTKSTKRVKEEGKLDNKVEEPLLADPGGEDSSSRKVMEEVTTKLKSQ